MKKQKKKKIKKRTIILIGLFAYVIVMTIVDTIIFCYKGSYPVEIYLANVPTILAELKIIFELKKLDVKSEKEQP